MRDDPFFADLVARARKGDQQAWDALVVRYSPLIWSICRRFRLDRADAEDVGQRIWLQFVNHLGAIRDPAAVPGWLATATRRECGRVVRAARGPRTAGQLLDEGIPDNRATTAEQELLAAERHAALVEAFTCLSPARQRLMAILIEDPPVPYAEISIRLGIPVSSIGPTRRRCLDQLRRHPAIVALSDADDWIVVWPRGRRGGPPEYGPDVRRPVSNVPRRASYQMAENFPQTRPPSAAHKPTTLCQSEE